MITRYVVGTETKDQYRYHVESFVSEPFFFQNIYTFSLSSRFLQATQAVKIQFVKLDFPRWIGRKSCLKLIGQKIRC